MAKTEPHFPVTSFETSCPSQRSENQHDRTVRADSPRRSSAPDLYRGRPRRFGLHARLPWPILAWPAPVRWVAAGLFVVSGLSLSAWVIRTLHRAGTPVSTQRVTVKLVQSGPYRWTRNPDYIGQLFRSTGLALAIGSWWTLATSVGAMVVAHVHAVRREERYMKATFGDAYAAYCRKVPRWFGTSGRP